eukprot:4798017-Prymnesium_polylepis.1
MHNFFARPTDLDHTSHGSTCSRHACLPDADLCSDARLQLDGGGTQSGATQAHRGARIHYQQPDAASAEARTDETFVVVARTF